MARDFAVRVEGLQALRRDLRDLGPDAQKELQGALKQAAELVAERARPLAPRKTGALAASIRGTTAGHKGIVRSPLPYAALQHFGGTTGRGHSRGRPGATRVRGTLFISRALEANQEAVVDVLGDAIEDAARRNGWH